VGTALRVAVTRREMGQRVIWKQGRADSKGRAEVMGWLLGCSKVTATRAGAIPPVIDSETVPRRRKVQHGARQNDRVIAGRKHLRQNRVPELLGTCGVASDIPKPPPPVPW